MLLAGYEAQAVSRSEDSFSAAFGPHRELAADQVPVGDPETPSNLSAARETMASENPVPRLGDLRVGAGPQPAWRRPERRTRPAPAPNALRAVTAEPPGSSSSSTASCPASTPACRAA